MLIFLKFTLFLFIMLYTKDGYPDINEIVYCTVRKIYGNTVFVYLDEYEKEGVLTISEIAPGRIRNLRDHVVEEKKIVCKVLRVDPKQKRIDVSLRRVSIPVMKKKLDEIKKEEYSERVYEEVSKEFSMTKDELFEKTYEVIFDEYETVFEALYDIMLDNDKIKMFSNLSSDQQKTFVNFINDRIKPEEIVLKKSFRLSSTQKEGVEQVKSAIQAGVDALNYDKVNVFYKAAGEFGITITHEDMKSADKLYTIFKTTLEDYSKKNDLQLEL